MPALLGFLAYCAVRLLGTTIRYRVHDESGRIQPDSREVFLFAFWHNRLALMPHLYRKFLRRKKLAALISASRDGEILAQLVLRFGYTPVRGSSSRRGAKALLELTRLVQEGFDAAVSPDGPRGPRYEAQSGIIDLAALTERPILPVTTCLCCKWELKSWDRFQVPIPFASCIIRVGAPITVPRDADDAMRESKRKELQEVLLRLEG